MFDRLLSVLLVEMDGLLSKSGNVGGDVFVLATTTDKSALDPAILRPG